jgi:hypothetical protein
MARRLRGMTPRTRQSVRWEEKNKHGVIHGTLFISSSSAAAALGSSSYQLTF